VAGCGEELILARRLVVWGGDEGEEVIGWNDETGQSRRRMRTCACAIVERKKKKGLVWTGTNAGKGMTMSWPAAIGCVFELTEAGGRRLR